MGLLDDAIREHLELKRRHGADPEEVSRQEREALGAPVRGEFAQPAVQGAPEAGQASEPADAAEPAGSPVPPDEPVDDMGDPDAVAAVSASEIEAEPALDEPDLTDSGPDEVDPPPEQAPAARDPAHEEDPWLVEDLADPPSTRTGERAQPADAEAAEGEDVLEETPEFLQETPEHERLWFEQKPPRDFDWDK